MFGRCKYNMIWITNIYAQAQLQLCTKAQHLQNICTVLLLTHIISNDFNDKIMSIKHCTCNIGERNSMEKMFMVINLK